MPYRNQVSNIDSTIQNLPELTHVDEFSLPEWIHVSRVLKLCGMKGYFEKKTHKNNVDPRTNATAKFGEELMEHECPISQCLNSERASEANPGPA
ncbi:hypothetical protein DPMN_110895 [Dreissena polymorpha]|uniref:Uncharacterized protein n=1 Tax=Dreissena polymorpha TaxID=45954 RepID=A0A9D4KDH9_DREPO|nr:hypothetical protein DPMN_110895 [Dreissena polymorpha]